MAHEVDVPVANDKIAYGDFLARIKQKWAALRPNDPISIKLEIGDLDPAQCALDVSVREKQASLNIHIDEEAAASCSFWHFRYELDRNDIETAYVNVCVSSWRDPQSTLLMALAASSIAEVAETFVIDEVSRFSAGRIVSPATIDAILATVADLPLAAAGEQLFGWLWPGDDV